MSAFLDLLAAAGVVAAWWTAASFTAGVLIAAIGFTRNTIRRRPR
ncbi:hypothetical protein [Streptomyces vilmorinianum]|nr:hypothetical protein [Streptomyces vilmorinianum]